MRLVSEHLTLCSCGVLIAVHCRNDDVVACNRVASNGKVIVWSCAPADAGRHAQASGVARTSSACVSDCTIANMSVSAVGAGLALISSSVAMENSRFVGNIAVIDEAATPTALAPVVFASSRLAGLGAGQCSLRSENVRFINNTACAAIGVDGTAAADVDIFSAPVTFVANVIDTAPDPDMYRHRCVADVPDAGIPAATQSQPLARARADQFATESSFASLRQV